MKGFPDSTRSSSRSHSIAFWMAAVLSVAPSGFAPNRVTSQSVAKAGAASMPPASAAAQKRTNEWRCLI